MAVNLHETETDHHLSGMSSTAGCPPTSTAWQKFGLPVLLRRQRPFSELRLKASIHSVAAVATIAAAVLVPLPPVARSGQWHP